MDGGNVRSHTSTKWQPSPNFDVRVPSYVVLHYTGENWTDDAVRVLTNPHKKVSAHYLISRDGLIIQLVDERDRAWHAGDSLWGSTSDLNSVSIGIELDNNGHEAYPSRQIQSLMRVLDDLRSRYRLAPANILGHSDIAPSRKSDPGPLFPWRVLAKNGFGLWCEPPYPSAPVAFDAMLGLKAIGYDIRNAEAAVRAFRTHYARQRDLAASVQVDNDQIYCLVQKSLSR